MREEGREGSARGEASRQSRRARGLPPEEQPDLDEILKGNRKVKAAKRKAALEEKKRSSVQDQPAPEPVVHDAHQVSADDESGSRPAEAKAVEGESVSEEPAQASEGGADLEVSPAVGRVSDSSLPVQDVELQDEAIALVEDKLLSTVQEDAVLEDLEVSSHLESKTSPVQEREANSTEALEHKPVSEAAVLDVCPGSHSGTGALDVQMDEEAAKAYVASQVSRWEQVRSERVYPPTVEYVWPESRPDSQVWMSAMVAASKYLHVQTFLDGSVQSWLAELDLERRDLATAQDLTAVQIPVGPLEPRECVAVLQTLLFEGGFQFENLVPVWFKAQASKVAPQLVRDVVGGAQRLLAVELIEWRQLIAGAKYKILPRLEARGNPERPPLLDYNVKEEEDTLTTDYEVDLLGRNYLLRLQTVGLRPVRSPYGSSIGEPMPKRQNRQLSLASQGSMTSELPLSEASREMSVQEPRVTTDLNADPLPSLVGTTDESSYGVTSSSYTSRNSSSASSSATLGHSAASHMPHVGYGPMVMTAQASSGPAGGDEVGFYVTHDVVPEVTVDQDDVDMTESALAVASKSSRTRKSRTHRKHRHSARSSSSSDSDSGSDEYRPRRSSHRKPSKRSSRRRSSSRRSSRSGRSSYSMRSGRSSASAMSGTAELTVSTLHKVHETLARLEDKAATTKLAEQEAEANRKVEEAERQVREAQSRALEAERRLQQATVQDVHAQSALASETSDVEALIKAACAEAVRVEGERVRALAQQHFTQQKAEEDARLEAERAAWTHQAQSGLEAQRQAFEQKLRNLEVECAREQEAAKNMQKFQAEQIRGFRTTSALSQSDRAANPPDLATRVKVESSDPERATKNPVPSGVNIGNATQKWTETGLKNLSEVSIAQLRATLPRVDLSALAGSSKLEATKREASASAAGTATRSTKAHGSRTEVSKSTEKREVKVKSDKKKSDRERASSKKARRRRDSSPDSDPTSSSDEDYSSSSDSDSSSDGDARSSRTLKNRSKVGSNVLTIRPYVNPNTLEKFDEKASLPDRRNWMERFTNMCTQGGWSGKVKLAELKMKMSAAVRNWRGQLPKHVQSNWVKLEREFRHKYLKARTSESERYYAMKQKPNETPMEFFYRLNEAAVKAGIKYRSTDKRRARHVKRYITSLRDSSLKSILRNQIFHTVDDLEAVLQQGEDLGPDGDYDSSSSRTRDFRADNAQAARFKPKRRAYVARNGESEIELDGHVHFEDDGGEPTVTQPEPASPMRSSCDGGNLEVTSKSSPFQNVVPDEDIQSVVYRVMERAGWRPPEQQSRPGWQSPKYENPDRLEFCEKCHQFGHKPENCWKDMVCRRCGRTGHPERVCRTRPCNNCDKFHDGKCEAYQTLQAVKDLARQGMLKDLPASVLKKLMDGEDNSGEPLNE